jgi:hypothetical protein
MGEEDNYERDCGTEDCDENDCGQCELSKDEGFDTDSCPEHTDP